MRMRDWLGAMMGCEETEDVVPLFCLTSASPACEELPESSVKMPSMPSRKSSRLMMMLLPVPAVVLL